MDSRNRHPAALYEPPPAAEDVSLNMVTSCDRGLGCLLDIQESDGGWAYSTHSSWTEPTCYAILALRSTEGPEPAIARACEWLARHQRRDGGWSPGPAVERSTHVTSLAVLALSGMPEYQEITERGVGCLLSLAGAETSLWARMARFATGTRSGATEHAGWPWFPGAAAWVIPTSLAVCALSRQRRGKYGGEIEKRVKEARQFLLSRQCPDQGWNHGGLFRAGEVPASYPETTGIALVALAGAAGPEIEAALKCGERHARSPRSSEGENWLRLGLRAHGRNVPPCEAEYRDWTVNQVALRIISEAAEAGSNPFVEHA
jgi:hypothetical protein